MIKHAGVFDGHGFNGRSAAVYARKNITSWLAVDANAASKDPKRRLKALESVCAQIARGLARQELCGFDATASGLASCCAHLQGDRLSVATIGEHVSRLHVLSGLSARFAICSSSHGDDRHPVKNKGETKQNTASCHTRWGKTSGRPAYNHKVEQQTGTGELVILSYVGLPEGLEALKAFHAVLSVIWPPSTRCVPFCAFQLGWAGSTT